MDSAEILALIEKISPHAKDFVENGLGDQRVEILHSLSTRQNKGIFLAVEMDDRCYFYAAYLHEKVAEPILEVIRQKTGEYISRKKSGEMCFNVFGKNQPIIHLVRNLGFKTDMEGYHLEFKGRECPELKDSGLIEKGFEDAMLDDFIDLFDSAYYAVNMENGWQVDRHAVNRDQFFIKTQRSGKSNQVRSFWTNHELAGAYIFEQNYITDLVIRPKFQKQGYGSYLLAHCLRNMRDRSIENIRLRVAASNVGAKKLYERNHFVEIACFAEHTYQCDTV